MLLLLLVQGPHLDDFCLKGTNCNLGTHVVSGLEGIKGLTGRHPGFQSLPWWERVHHTKEERRKSRNSPRIK